MQAVPAFSAKDIDSEIECQIVLVTSRATDVADANRRPHRPGTVDHDHSPCPRPPIGWLWPRSLSPAPPAESPLRAGKRFVVADVANDGEDGVVGAEPGFVEGHEIVARDA